MTGQARNSAMLYRIDAGHSNFTAQAFAEGLLSFIAHNPVFTIGKYGGEIQIDIDTGEAASVLIVVKSESISLLDKVSEMDRTEIENVMRIDVLEIGNFPEITFVSKDVTVNKSAPEKFQVKASGYLSLHGTSRLQTITADAEFKNGNMRATGEFRLKQSDFDITPVKALGGTLKVRDEVKISFEIEANI